MALSALLHVVAVGALAVPIHVGLPMRRMMVKRVMGGLSLSTVIYHKLHSNPCGSSDAHARKTAAAYGRQEIWSDQ